MTSYSNYRKNIIVSEKKKIIDYLYKDNTDIDNNFNLYFKNLFHFDINKFERGNNFNEKFINLLYFSYNEIKKEKKEDNYVVTNFYEDYYFIKKLITEIYIGKTSERWDSSVNKEFFKNHYHFLIYILIYIIKIIKYDKYRTPSSGSNSVSVSVSSSGSSYGSSSYESNWEKKKYYINFIYDFLFLLEQESVSGIYDVTSKNNRELFKSLYDYIEKFKDEDKIKISNSHIMICIKTLNSMNNKTRVKLKQHLSNSNKSTNKRSNNRSNKSSNNFTKKQKVLGGTKKKKTKKQKTKNKKIN
tara:strand:- start:379 stop:1278 length:900 start_codon:yes stop_codon:yes gene_type:complete